MQTCSVMGLMFFFFVLAPCQASLAASAPVLPATSSSASCDQLPPHSSDGEFFDNREKTAVLKADRKTARIDWSVTSVLYKAQRPHAQRVYTFTAKNCGQEPIFLAVPAAHAGCLQTSFAGALKPGASRAFRIVSGDPKVVEMEIDIKMRLSPGADWEPVTGQLVTLYVPATPAEQWRCEAIGPTS
ncbi:MAG: hypothetical protein IVW54_18485 [Candidatus Binataceae bacterium]|nr:hypothetical protein [Candidatus Binataceae bacterium]